MFVKTFGAALHGIDANIVTVEVSITRGISFFLVGLPDSSVKESQHRISTALAGSGYKMPGHRIVINMAPADIRKEGAAYDLTIAVAILAASGQIKSNNCDKTLIMGELSLDGTLRPIKGVLSIALKAKETGFTSLLLPAQNAKEAAVVKGIDVYGISGIKEVAGFFNGNILLNPIKVDPDKIFTELNEHCDIDFSDVKGQENVKRALEIAAAGSHNVLMLGGPGAGKTMLAKRLPTILPPLTIEESLETTKIHSVAGKIADNCSIIVRRPFRSPHSTISATAMAGGGTIPKPGEVSLSHNGVLFLDELPEFNRSVLEVMRQPLEEHSIDISRAKFSVRFPARFMLVASMNPCPCGYYNCPGKECICSPGTVRRYLNRISGPLFDRFDIHLEVVPVAFEELSGLAKPEASSVVRERVNRAREIQGLRYSNDSGIYTNSQIHPKLLNRYCSIDSSGTLLMKNVMTRLGLSARAYHRILKLSRTIADLEGSSMIQNCHLAEAIQYRTLDRNSWAG